MVLLSIVTISSNAATKIVEYTVKSGDTLSGIAVKNDTTVASIREVNALKKGQTLKLGKVLRVLAKIKSIDYTIKSGDTLSGIAVKNSTTVSSIMKANSMKKGDTLKLGKVIVVPTEVATVASAKVIKRSSKKRKSKIVKHTVKSGDTLSVLASKNHTTVSSIMKANGMKKDDTLKLGKVLTIPTKAVTVASAKTIKKSSRKRKSKLVKHTVKRGDTLSVLASKNHTTVSSIMKANSMKKGDMLKLGKVLTIPTKVNTSKSKKRIKIASSRTKRGDRQLAKTLKSTKFKKSNSKKSSKFSIGDILFTRKSNKKSAKMIKLAKNKLGRRYVWGATGSKNTFDCSGLTTYVCKKNGISIPRRAIQQSKHGKYISRKNLKPGDLVFFDTSKRKKGYVNHVGIYIGNNKFIHASSAKKKVVTTSLSKNFYSRRYKGARRVSTL